MTKTQPWDGMDTHHKLDLLEAQCDKWVAHVASYDKWYKRWMRPLVRHYLDQTTANVASIRSRMPILRSHAT